MVSDLHHTIWFVTVFFSFTAELEDELAKDLPEYEVVSGNKVDDEELARELASFDVK